MKKAFLTQVVFVFLLTACGGGGGDNTESPVNNDITMQKGEIYWIHKGDIVIRKSELADVEFETIIETGVTTSKLINGEAVIREQ